MGFGYEVSGTGRIGGRRRHHCAGQGEPSRLRSAPNIGGVAFLVDGSGPCGLVAIRWGDCDGRVVDVSILEV